MTFFFSEQRQKDLEARVVELEKQVFKNGKSPLFVPLITEDKLKNLPPLSLLSIQSNGSIPLRILIELYRLTQPDHHLPIILGTDKHGNVTGIDLFKTPHILIGGTTGSGKTNFLRVLIATLLFHLSPDELRFIFIDPKRIDLSPLVGLPHNLVNVVVEPRMAFTALRWLICEMEERYKKLAKVQKRNINEYNLANQKEKMPFIVCVIDELADLMMLEPEDLETYITRLAQLSRAVGIHLVIGTQRPSTKVLTGLMKANIPTRIAFSVASKRDSSVILDQTGAEQLKEPGDMLFMPPDQIELTHIHAPQVTEEELGLIVEWWKKKCPKTAEESFQNPPTSFETKSLFKEAIQIATSYGKISTALLQRKLQIGYSRAAELIDKMEDEGYVGPATGSGQPRKILKK